MTRILRSERSSCEIPVFLILSSHCPGPGSQPIELLSNGKVLNGNWAGHVGLYSQHCQGLKLASPSGAVYFRVSRPSTLSGTVAEPATLQSVPQDLLLRCGGNIPDSGMWGRNLLSRTRIFEKGAKVTLAQS